MTVCDFHEDMKETVHDHEKRIEFLEKKDAGNDVRIENLCKQLENLTGWVKALVISLVTSLLTCGGGFIIWYIQSLPR
ncbi:MAG: hypothetical protein PHT02_06975 [Tissierellia bacterium]|nr:hypothetical protein [Tissierellia bacterium]